MSYKMKYLMITVDQSYSDSTISRRKSYLSKFVNTFNNRYCTSNLNIYYKKAYLDPELNLSTLNEFVYSILSDY